MRVRLFASISTAAVLGATGACAQSVGSSVIQLDEVTVTARKTTESLKDVPISVSTFDAETLTERGATRISDLQFAVPNLSFNGIETSVQPSVTIRGVAIDQRDVGVEASYGVYIDGVLAGRSAAVNQELLDIERVEVLRGPQGTLFGKNTTTGAINIVTRRPGEDVRASAAVELGSYDRRRAEASVSGPLAEGQLFGKISLLHSERDGWVKVVNNGKTQADDKVDAGRAALLFTPSEKLSLYLSADYARQKSLEYYGEAVTEVCAPLPAGAICNTLNIVTAYPGVTPGARTVLADYNVPAIRKFGGLALTIDYAFDNGFKLTSITAGRGAKSHYGSDFDRRADNIAYFDIGLEERQITQEIRLQSPRMGAFDFMAGGFYFDQHAAQNEILRGGPLFGDLRLPPTFVWPDGDPIQTYLPRVDTRSVAAFMTANWYASEGLTVTLGMRYTNEKKDLRVNQFGLGVVAYTNYRDSIESNAFSPALSAVYKITPDINIYASYSNGFKSGGWNGTYIPSVQGADISFDDEKASNYEIGFKSTLFDRRLQLNASLYYLDYSDFQLVQNIPGIGTVTTNAGAVSSRGGEVEVQARVAPGLTLSGGVGYAYARYDAYSTGTVSFTGNRLNYSPMWTANISAEYRRPLESFGGEGFIRLDYGFRSRSFTSPANNPNARTDEMNLLNGRIGLSRDRWEVAVFGSNLLDVTEARQVNYRQTSIISGLNIVREDRVYNAPRQFGVRLSYKY